MNENAFDDLDAKLGVRLKKSKATRVTDTGRVSGLAEIRVQCTKTISQISIKFVF